MLRRRLSVYNERPTEGRIYPDAKAEKKMREDFPLNDPVDIQTEKLLNSNKERVTYQVLTSLPRPNV